MTTAVDITEDGWLLLHKFSPSHRALLYNPVLQTFTGLGVLDPEDPTTGSAPVDMNASHVVALNSDGRAARWTSGALVSIHPAAAGDQNSECEGINASGHIVGDFTDPAPSNKNRAFLDRAGTTTLIGDASVHTRPARGGINDNDVVVGHVDSGSSSFPFVWTPTTGLQLIPLLPGTTSGVATAVNNAGDVVGHMSNQAFLYRNGTVHKLLDLIAGIPGASDWTLLRRADFINDNNDIVGVGTHLGVTKAYRLHLPP